MSDEEIRNRLAQVEERLTRIERKIDEIAKAQQCTFKLYDNQDLMEMLHMSYRELARYRELGLLRPIFAKRGNDKNYYLIEEIIRFVHEVLANKDVMKKLARSGVVIEE